MQSSEHSFFYDLLLNLDKHTNPTDPTYMKNKDRLPFRRHEVRCEDICSRVIEHGLKNQEDWQTTRRIFTFLINVLEHTAAEVEAGNCTEEFQLKSRRRGGPRPAEVPGGLPILSRCSTPTALSTPTVALLACPPANSVITVFLEFLSDTPELLQRSARPGRAGCSPRWPRAARCSSWWR